MAPWKNTTWIDLTRYQVEFEQVPGVEGLDPKEHCLIYALRQSGRVTPTLLRAMADMIYGVNLTMKSLKEMCRRIGLSLEIICYTENSVNYVHILEGEGDPIHIGLYDDHYFLNDKVVYSEWVLDNLAEARERGPHADLGWGYKVEAGHRVRDHRCVRTSGALLRALHQRGLLRKARGNDVRALTQSCYAPKNFDEDDLSYCPQFCKPIELNEKTDQAAFWFADFETTTNGDQHLPYLLVAIGTDPNLKYVAKNYATTPENVCAIWGRKLHFMFEYMNEATPRNAQVTILFHNLNYDAAFIIPYLLTERPFGIVEVNGKIISFSYFHPGTRRTYHFRDSYALISAPLRAFGKMFGLEIEKEIFPYTFYSTDNFAQFSPTWPRVPLEAFLAHYATPTELERKVRQLGYVDLDGWVNAHAYTVYYCLRDCEVLRAGFLKFREQLMEVTQLDCGHFLTLPSIAYNFLIKEGVFEGCFNLVGQPLFFIRKCVLGGRCMLRRNEKQDVSGDIADFDAVSLYPSAMARLYTLKGLPRLVEDQNLAQLFAMDGFFVKVRIDRVPRTLDFPLLAQDSPTGIKVYANEPGVFYVDDISLRNIIDFHKVSMNDIHILCGYYYNDGKNDKIQTTIRHLFNRRNELKRAGNPLEQIYKLLMNSCYGKSIMKPILTQSYIADRAGLRHIVDNHATATLSYRQIGDKYAVEVAKDLVAAEGFPAFGVHILAMSKRIMSEVMVTAEDLGIDVFYTDTDSIHLRSECIPALAEEFDQRYHRTLIGKDLGQFHTDFPDDPHSGLPTTSRRFIGVGKKAYIDQLEDAQGNVSYHMRLKGIPNDIIKLTADEHFGGDPMALYEALAHGDAVTFNLLANRVSFELRSDMTYHSRTSFTREVNF